MLQFSKYQGLGNDFVLLEGRGGQLPLTITEPDPHWVRQLCDRRFGIGGDGLILALPPQHGEELRMRIFNADGSEAEMCGNGIRCLARFLADSDGDQPGRTWRIETMAGIIVPELCENGQIRVDMGQPFLNADQVPTTLSKGRSGLPQGEIDLQGSTLQLAAVGMGNPHVVVPVQDLKSIPFDAWGSALEIDPLFPAKTNVHFLEVIDQRTLEIRVWERGAGPTLACGTGACATLVAAKLLGLSESEATVILPGGPLEISWPDPKGSVFMTGPAIAVFDGVPNPELLPQTSPSETPFREPIASTVVEEISPLPTDISPADQIVTKNIDSENDLNDDSSQTDQDLSDEAQARVQKFLSSTSLDAIINIAAESLEERSMSRLNRDDKP
jgi:diaminopimelate epimerase